MMNSPNFDPKLAKFYTDECRRIHAICYDNNIPEEKARLLSYMHVKSIDENNGINYFRKPNPTDKEAIETMLGYRNMDDIRNINFEDEDGTITEFLSNLHSIILQIDKKLYEDYGFENRLVSELKGRYKLYVDKLYCEEMICLYKNVIYKHYCSYTDEMIEKAFKKKQSEEQELNSLLDSLI